jgi:hypothetical protein
MVSIKRDEVMRRAATIWPMGHVKYSQGALRNGWRTDCSGFVSMCLNLAGVGWGGANTVTLVTGGYVREIARNDLRPGDLVGHCGPGTAGDDGHVVLFDQWRDDNHSRYLAYEMTGEFGPKHRVIHYPYDGVAGGWKAYQYRPLADDEPSVHGGRWVAVRAWPDRLSTISGIAEKYGWGDDWQRVWNDPNNDGLHGHRGVPEHIQPGDAVWVPAP